MSHESRPVGFKCRVCANGRISDILDFGRQAIRNRFLQSPHQPEYTHPLQLGYCGTCVLVQLIDPPPVAELRPRFSWVTYNEPESHLDALVAGLIRLPGLTPQSTFAGLTYKDDSTLARLNRNSFTNTWRPELHELGIEEPNSGIESVQARLHSEHAAHLIRRYGRPDVVLFRHVLEHTQDTRAALAWAKQLVWPGGYIVVEVPDTGRALARRDYTTVWEEHVLYFTPFTLRRCFEASGFQVESVQSFPYTLENSLVVIARPGEAPTICSPPELEMARANGFVRDYPRIRELFRSQLHGYERVAMLGAGHLTGAFINLYGLCDRIEFVVDDNPHKQGLHMPGSRLPITASSALLDHEIDLCLMTVRPEIEEAVMRKNHQFLSRGGILASVFPDSPYSIDRVCRSSGAHV